MVEELLLYRIKGTQLVFSDMGTPVKHAKKEMKEYRELKEKADLLNDEELVAIAQLGDESAKTRIEEAETAAATLEAKGRDWKDAIGAAARGFSIYDDLKAALIEHGIPEKEIAFIHDYNTDDQKDALFQSVNSGRIRVLIGSTPKMGAGTNVQERLVALHHIDVPWKPSDVEQREGRIIRQGNVLLDALPDFEVEILAYATQDTLDLRMWQTQEEKLKMIGQLRKRENLKNEIENSFEDMTMSASEMQAAATSNPYFFQEIQLKNKVKDLERQQRAHQSQANELNRKMREAQRNIEVLPKEIKDLETIHEAQLQYRDRIKAEQDKFKASINAEEFTDKDKVGEALRELAKMDYPDFPVDIEFNGKKYTDRFTLDEAYRDFSANHDGDTLVSVNGKEVNLRSFGRDAGDEIGDIIKTQDKVSRKAYDKTRPSFSVEFNGITYTSRPKLADAWSDTVGDDTPILWNFDGTMFNRRTRLADAIQAIISEVIQKESERHLGTMGGISVSVSPVDSKSLEVIVEYAGSERTGEVYVETTNKDEPDLRATSRKVVDRAEAILKNLSYTLRWKRDDLAKAEKTLKDVSALGGGKPWGKEEELKAARREYAKIVKLIDDLANPTKRQEETRTTYRQGPTPRAADKYQWSIENVKPWPEGFPKIYAQTHPGKVINHPDHTAAKAGDIDSAIRLVDALAKPEKMMELGRLYPDATLVAVHSQEASGKNAIPQV